MEEPLLVNANGHTLSAKKGYKYGEASWVQDTNLPMNRAAQMMSGVKYKTYRVYRKNLV